VEQGSADIDERRERPAGASGEGPPDAPALAAELAAARRRAEELLPSGGGWTAALAAAAVLSRLALAGGWSQQDADALLASAGVEPELRSAALLTALREPSLLSQPPRQAIEAVLRLLVLLGPVAEASLWLADPGGRPQAIAAAGAPVPGRSARRAAHGVLSGDDVPPPAGSVRAVLAGGAGRPEGALVVRARRGQADRADAVAREAAAVLAAALERDELLARSEEGQRVLVDAAERRLSRIGFDLHDGPLQDLALLRGDLRLLRRQLGGQLADDLAPLVQGRVDDLLARLDAVDDGLRAFARSFESPALLKKPFTVALEEEVAAFAARAGMRSGVVIEGDLDALTASQRIAIFRVVQEALANVREHSGASAVQLEVRALDGHVRASVRDDGAGFDVDAAAGKARSAGRLGLVGMAERARMLGGTVDLESRPGGPTTVTLTLPAWRPRLAGDARRRGAA
jgi:signal transduction histidine kinase